MTHHVLQKAINLSEYMVKARHQLHRSPELSFQEYQATAFVKNELESYGIRIIPSDFPTGVFAVIEGGKGGSVPVTALRADIDALPIHERTGLPYSSITDGVMHACGHDGHTATLLGAARILQEMKGTFPGVVKLLFQPAEETLRGAQTMIEAGVLQNPQVDTILGFHGWPTLEVGNVGICQGSSMAASDRFEVTVKGIGGHAGYPHTTTDPLFAGAQAVVALQQVVSRQTDPLQPLVISVCTFKAGDAFNVIPSSASFEGTVRSHDDELRRTIEGRMRTILNGVLGGARCSFDFTYSFGVPSVVSNSEVMRKVVGAAKETLGKKRVKIVQPSMGAEDFSLFLQHVPKGCYFYVGIKPVGKDVAKAHNDRFDYHDDALAVGAAVLAEYVLSVHR